MSELRREIQTLIERLEELEKSQKDDRAIQYWSEIRRIEYFEPTEVIVLSPNPPQREVEAVA